MLVEVGETPRAAEVVFRSGAAPRRVLFIAVDVHFDFAFAPPAAFQRGQRKVGADVRAMAVHIVENRVVTGNFGDAFAAPLRMEAHRIGWQRVVFRVVDLVEEGRHVLVVIVAQHNARVLERHGEIAVETSIWHHHDRDGIDTAGLCVTAAEEIADRALHGRRLLAIPIEFEDEIAQYVRTGRGSAVGDRHPNVANHARAIDVHQRDRIARLDRLDARAALT